MVMCLRLKCFALMHFYIKNVYSSVESCHKMQAGAKMPFLWYHDFQSDNEWQTIKLYYFYVIKSI